MGHFGYARHGAKDAITRAPLSLPSYSTQTPNQKFIGAQGFQVLTASDPRDHWNDYIIVVVKPEMLARHLKNILESSSSSDPRPTLLGSEHCWSRAHSKFTMSQPPLSPSGTGARTTVAFGHLARLGSNSTGVLMGLGSEDVFIIRNYQIWMISFHRICLVKWIQEGNGQWFFGLWNIMPKLRGGKLIQVGKR